MLVKRLLTQSSQLVEAQTESHPSLFPKEQPSLSTHTSCIDGKSAGEQILGSSIRTDGKESDLDGSIYLSMGGRKHASAVSLESIVPVI
jgi:hypothetical protein